MTEIIKNLVKSSNIAQNEYQEELNKLANELEN